MTFDNSKTIIALRLRVFIATILLIVFIFFAFLEKNIRFPVLGLDANAWTTIILLIYAGLAFYPLALKYKYFYYSDDGPNLVLRYYPVGLFSGKKNSVEIPKSEFAGYRIEAYDIFFKKIILSRKIDRRIAQYPEIHLGSLRKKEVYKLTSSLDSFLQAK
jgi:hypothetical protein